MAPYIDSIGADGIYEVIERSATEQLEQPLRVERAGRLVLVLEVAVDAHALVEQRP